MDKLLLGEFQLRIRREAQTSGGAGCELPVGMDTTKLWLIIGGEVVVNCYPVTFPSFYPGLCV